MMNQKSKKNFRSPSILGVSSLALAALFAVGEARAIPENTGAKCPCEAKGAKATACEQGTVPDGQGGCVKAAKSSSETSSDTSSGTSAQ